MENDERNTSTYPDNTTHTTTAPEYSKIPTCPVCHGSKWEFYRVNGEYERMVYGEKLYPEGVEYARPCTACERYRNGEIQRLKAVANIPIKYKDSLIIDFRWDIYRDDNGTICNTQYAKETTDSIINRFPEWEKDGRGLYIYSLQKGSGKTFLASCIANHIIMQPNTPVTFVSCSNLIGESKKEQTDRFIKTPVLIIDDIGAQNNGREWLEDLLFTIIDERMQKQRVTIFTSNVMVKDLVFDDRIKDRINSMCLTVKLPNVTVRANTARDSKKEFYNRVIKGGENNDKV